MTSAFARPVFLKQGQVAEALSLPIFPKEHACRTEKWLQDLIHDNPELLPIEEIEPGFGKPVAVCRELATNHGFIDNLLITPEGNIVVVEVKLWRNPEARRAVVAQALDYASCLFEMSYDELESAILSADTGRKKKAASLYELVNSTLPEARFVDAVSANLEKGRLLILVVGDGIRTEAKRLISLMQTHANALFTFALVELAVFAIPNDEGLVVCPRILAQTEMIQRTVFHVKERVSSPQLDQQQSAERNVTSPSIIISPNITQAQFFEDMERIHPDIPKRLRTLIAQFASIGVYDEFKRSLNFKWEGPAAQVISLGYISRDGRLWTDTVCRAPYEPYHRYIEDLAAAFGLDVVKGGAGEQNWSARKNDSFPRVDALLEKLERWPSVVERLLLKLGAQS